MNSKVPSNLNCYGSHYNMRNCIRKTSPQPFSNPTTSPETEPPAPVMISTASIPSRTSFIATESFPNMTYPPIQTTNSLSSSLVSGDFRSVNTFNDSTNATATERISSSLGAMDSARPKRERLNSAAAAAFTRLSLDVVELDRIDEVNSSANCGKKGWRLPIVNNGVEKIFVICISTDFVGMYKLHRDNTKLPFAFIRCCHFIDKIRDHV